MKRRLILLISLYLIAVTSTLFLIKGYYNTDISDFKQDYTITSLNFSVNGISAKNIGESDDELINTHTIDLTDISLDHNDSFSVDVELAARGTSNGSYAIDYTIEATSSDTEGNITPYIMVMQKINGKYTFIGYLNDFLKSDLNGLVGLNENKTYNYMFSVVPNTNIDFNNETLDLTFEATYNIDVSQEKLDNYPYYYLSNSYEVAGSGSIGDSIFSKLVNKEVELKGKTIVLTSDFDDFSENENIILPFKVGIDLNGHKLDLNGGSITIKPTDSTDTDVYIKDTNGGGSIIDGFIYIDSSNDVIKVSDELLSDTESDNYSKIVVVNASVSKFSEIIKDQITEISSTPLIGETDDDTVVNVDVTEGIKFYLKKGFTTLAVTESGLTVDNPDIGIYSLNRTETTYNHDLVFLTTNESDNSISTLSDSIFTLGNESEDVGKSLLNDIPDEISTSIFLPSYDLSTKSEFYWTTDNEDLLDKNGQYLKNGLEALETYKNQEVLLTLVTEKNGKFYPTEKIVTIVVFSLEERINLLSLSHQILLSTTGVNIDGVGVFDINNIVKLNNLVNTDEDYLTYMEQTYNITSDLTTTSEQVTDVDDQFAEKIGLVSINIPDVEDVGASQLNIANDDYSYYLSDSDNSAGLNKYYVNVIKNEHSSYDSFTLSVNTLPDKEIKFFDFQTSYLFYSAENDTITTQVISSILSEVQLQPEANQNEAVDPFNQLISPLIQYESDMTSSFEEVTRQNSITNVDYDINKYYYLDDDLEKVYEYKTTLVLTSEIEGYTPTYELISIGGVLVADYEGDLPIILTSSTTDSEGNDYTNSDGEVISVYTITILPSYVPDSDTEIVLTATLDTGNDEAQTYSIPFTMQGIISNSSTGITDSNLYYSLLDAADANSDGYLTTAEAEQLEDITFDGSSSKYISTINGLDLFTNLINVKLDNNEIINVDVFKDLKDLETLDISGNEIVQLSSLENIDSLTDFNVSNNEIVSLEPLLYLTSIEYLDISDNSISNFEYISNYENLIELYVYENPGASEATSEYYFAKIYNNSDESTDIYRTDESNVMSFATDAVEVTKILDSIRVAVETYGNLSLTHNIQKNLLDYTLIYSSSDTSENIISFTDTDDEGNVTQKEYPYYEYKNPNVDTDITIFVQVSNDSTGTTYSQTMQFPISMLKSTDPENDIYIETESGVFLKLEDVIPDNKLSTILYNTYNDDSDSTTYEHFYNDGLNSYIYPNKNVISIAERNVINEPDLKDEGIVDLTGINYFSFTKLNLSNNDINSLEPLISSSNLTDLTLGGMSYNFDELAGIGTTTEKNMILENLYLSGTFNLENYDTLTSLYHVYKNNNQDYNADNITNTLDSDSFINIYLTDDLTTTWNPFYDQLRIKASIYQESFYLYSLNQTASLDGNGIFDNTAKIIFYDDVEATEFDIRNNISFSGGFSNKVSVIDTSRLDDDGSTVNTFDFRLDYLVGYEGQFLYTISFTSGTQTVDSTTFNFESDYKVTSPIHIEYNDNYYVNYSVSGGDDTLGEETKISEIFNGALLRDMAMTAISDIDNPNSVFNSDGSGYLLPDSFLSTTLGSMYSDNSHLLTKNNDDDTVSFEGDKKTAIEGLRYFTNITKIISVGDADLETGIDLKNITYLGYKYSVVDFSSITEDCSSVTTINIYQPLGLNIYDSDYYDSVDESLYTDENCYYLNRFPNINIFNVYRQYNYTPQFYDFRGLRGLIGNTENTISSMLLYGLVGSQYPSTKTILDSIYDNSSNEPTFTISNSSGTNNIKISYLPASSIDENITAITEYKELYKDIVDFGPEVKVNGETMYHYQDPIQLYDGSTGDSLTLPGYIKNFGGDIDGDGNVDIDYDKDDDSDNIVYKLDSNGNEYTIGDFNSVRRFNITWYVYTRDIEAIKLILGIDSEDAQPIDVSVSSISKKGLYKYKLTNLNLGYSLEDTIFNFSSPLYDTTFIIEGVIGDAVNNVDLSDYGLVNRSYVYPITVLGTAAYTPEDNSDTHEYEYLINGNYYYSYRTFSENEFRFANWLAFNYTDLSADEVSSYYYEKGTTSSTYGLLSKDRVDLVDSIRIYGSGDNTISSSGQTTSYQLKKYFSANYANECGARAYLYNSINNLDGIGIFTNLENLQVGNGSSQYTQIQDVSFLQYLTNLSSLKIIGGSFHDISSIKNCLNLTSITLSYCEFETTYYENSSGNYESYFKNMTGLSLLDLDHCVGVTYIDLLALKSDLDADIIDKYDNKSWVTVTKNGTEYTATAETGLFVGTENSIISSGDVLDFGYTESSYFVSDYLAMSFLFDMLSTGENLKSVWTNKTDSDNITKEEFNIYFNTVLEGYYLATYTTIENGTSFNLGNLSPTLMLPDIGSFNIDGELTDLDDRFKVLPGAFNIPVKYEVPFGNNNYDLYLDFNYYVSVSGNTDKIYLYYTDESNNEWTVDINDNVIPYVVGDSTRKDIRDIFGPSICEYLINDNLDDLKSEVVGGQTYIFDVNSIKKVDLSDDDTYIHSVLGLEYLPNLYSFSNKYNPIVEYPYFLSSINAENITTFNINNDGKIIFKYFEIEDLNKFKNLINIETFKATHLIGDFSNTLPGETYTFADCITYRFTKLTTFYSSHNGLYYAYNADGTIDEAGTYDKVNKMFVNENYFTLFGVENEKTIDNITYNATSVDGLKLNLKPFIENTYSYYAISGPMSLNYVIDISYFVAVRFSNQTFYPTVMRYFFGYDRFIYDKSYSTHELVNNYLSIMNRDQSVHWVTIDSNRFLLYYEFNENSQYFMPQKEYYYGHWVTLDYSGNEGIGESMNQEYLTYGVRDTLIIPSLIPDEEGLYSSVPFRLYINYPTGNTRDTNLKTLIIPSDESEVMILNQTNNYYVEIEASETISKYTNYKMSDDGTRYFVNANEVFGNGNALFFIFYGYESADSYDTRLSRCFYHDNNHTIGYANTNKDGEINLSDGVLLNSNLLDLAEQQSITGFYNSTLNTSRNLSYINSFAGFERFTGLTEFYDYRYNSYNNIQINSVDLSPFANLSLTQFHVSGNLRLTTNDLLPLIEGSRESLLSFSYITTVNNPSMFDLNILLAFTKLNFCYINESDDLNYTNSLSFRNFISYLYLYKTDLYNHFYVEDNSYPYLLDLYSYTHETWNFSRFSINAEIFGPDLVNAEILNKLNMEHFVITLPTEENDYLEINDYSYLDLSETDTLGNLPTFISFGGVDYPITIESDSAFIDITGNTLSVINRDKSPGYGFIKIRLLDSTTKTTTEAERIIFVKL